MRRQLEQVCTVNKHLTDFLKLLGEEAINKAFRAASLRLHPDKGGNEEEFKELSRLHDWIVEELRKAP